MARSGIGGGDGGGVGDDDDDVDGDGGRRDGTVDFRRLDGDATRLVDVFDFLDVYDAELAANFVDVVVVVVVLIVVD